MNTIIEKIRALINMQIRREELNFASLGGGGQTMNIGALEWVLKQLDTLQEQPVDYEEELNKCKANPLYFWDKYVKVNFKEQPVKTNIVEDLKHYLATTPKEQIEKDWESLKEWGKVGPSVSEFLGWKEPVCEDVEKEEKPMNPVCKGLEEEQTCKGFEEEFRRFIKKEKEEEPDGSLPYYGDYGIYRIARHFAKWGAERQKEQDDRLVDIIYQQGIEFGKDEIRETLEREEKK